MALTSSTAAGAFKLSSKFLGGLYKVKSKNINGITQVALITSKALRQDRPARPAPFDYRNYLYQPWHVFTDPMDKRFDDNSKIIVIDGLPGIGKSKFAGKLADELEMYHMPPMTFDNLYIDTDGFDYRSLNSQLPDEAHYFDEKTFLANPTGPHSTIIQLHYYVMRYSTYIDALNHVLSTGQGVVLERSPWSDICFTKSMHTCGYISNDGFSYYKNCLVNSLYRLLRPHLVIYLDASVDFIKTKIQERCQPHETNSPALSKKYLNELERNYKEIYLSRISKHAQLLIYDWQDEPLFSDIIDDIEGLECDVDQFEPHAEKLRDWRFQSFEERREARSVFSRQKRELLQDCMASRFDVPDVLISGQAWAKREELLNAVYEDNPGRRFARGFNPDTDKGVLWKTRNRYDDFHRKGNQISSESKK